MPAPERLTIHIRLTPALLRQLKMVAAESGRSMNAEVSSRLERSFGPEDKDRLATMKLLTEALAILEKGSGT